MKALKVAGIVIFSIVVISFVTGHGYIWGGIQETYFRGWKNSNIDDIEFRDLRTIESADSAHAWVSKPVWGLDFTEEAKAWHEEYMSASFLVLHGDSVLFERYMQGFDENTVSNSFSACKTIVALATGLAVTQGLVDVDDELAQYIPRFADDAGKGLTVKEVLQMRSHIPFGEDYSNPIGFMAKAYYRGEIQSLLEPYRVPSVPGVEWKYQGGNTLLLGELMARLDQGSLSEWVERGLWKPMGAENDAFWGLDAPDEMGGIERCFAAYYATPRDFARFGKLINHGGKWNGERLIDSTFMAELVRPIHETATECTVDHYGYQIWLGRTEDGLEFSCMEGLRGQFVVSVPSLDLVVVRTGFKKDEHKTDELPSDVYRIVNMGRRVLDLDQKPRP